MKVTPLFDRYNPHACVLGYKSFLVKKIDYNMWRFTHSPGEERITFCGARLVYIYPEKEKNNNE